MTKLKLRAFAGPMEALRHKPGPEVGAVTEQRLVHARRTGRMAFEYEISEVDERRAAESAAKQALEGKLEVAKREGKCTVLVTQPTNHHSTPAIAAETGVCGAKAEHEGYCITHFCSNVLGLAQQPGGGKKLRPFSIRQIPLGRMSEAQIDVLRQKRGLPMNTPYDECIKRINEVDPDNSIESIPYIPKKSTRSN